MREVAGQIPENSRELLAAILKEATGEALQFAEQIRGIGMNNSVSVVSCRQGRFVIRTNVESHLFRYEREAWCYQQLAGTPVLTPEVLRCGVLQGHSFSVARFIEGSEPIGLVLDQNRIWRVLGSYGRYLNQVNPPSAPEELARLFPQGWAAQVEADVSIIFRGSLWLDRGFLTPEQQGVVRGYLEGCASGSAPLGICQFDMTVANAVICNGDYQKIYLLDLESANIAPVPYYQLACIAADKGPSSEPARAFFEGYGPGADQDPAELRRFLLYRVMRATAWARDRYPALLDENLERTRPVLAQALSSLGT